MASRTGTANLREGNYVIAYKETMGSKPYNLLSYDRGYGGNSLRDGSDDPAEVLRQAKAMAEGRRVPLVVSPEFLHLIPDPLPKTEEKAS